jgi:hypothetical protein
MLLESIALIAAIILIAAFLPLAKKAIGELEDPGVHTNLKPGLKWLGVLATAFGTFMLGMILLAPRVLP